MAQMIFSPTLPAFIAGFEGEVLHAYQDQKGVWTIGVGHTGSVKQGDTCTQGQALAWLADDMLGAAAAVNRLVKVSVNQNQFDALVSFTFNEGQGNLAESTLLRRLNAGDYFGAASEFLKWTMIGGKTSAGLFRRRIAERDLFTKPV